MSSMLGVRLGALSLSLSGGSFAVEFRLNVDGDSFIGEVNLRGSAEVWL